MNDTFRIDDDGCAWIGDKRMPWARTRRESHALSGGHVHHTRGIHMRFENGWLLSITWGTGTYSSNRWWPLRDISSAERVPFIEEPREVEVWSWWGESQMHPPSTKDWDWEEPIGYVSVPDVLRIIEWLQTLPSPTPEEVAETDLKWNARMDAMRVWSERVAAAGGDASKVPYSVEDE